jgi:Protein of unknown function (DUF3616)
MDWSKFRMRAVSGIVFLALAGALARAEPAVSPRDVLVFRGASDASAAVAVADNMFIVGDDENNTLRIYSTNRPGLPIASYDLTKFLDIEAEHPEADIEGATKIGRRIYWITSHGRNRDGKIRPNRYRFFATDLSVDNSRVTIEPVGRACRTLIHELVRTAAGRRLGLNKVTRFGTTHLKKKQRQKLAPKKEGLNIEGLAASPDGRMLYIGFRNPRPVNRRTGRAEAIVVPLENPAAVVEHGRKPVFGEPLLWDLAGLGIRGMEYCPFYKAYFIVAGSAGGDEERGFVLYRWSGRPDENPTLVRKLGIGRRQFSPETLIPFAGSDTLLLLSDDGSIPVKVAGPQECAKGQYRKDGTCQNKYLLDPNKKTFRALWLIP